MSRNGLSWSELGQATDHTWCLGVLSEAAVSTSVPPASSTPPPVSGPGAEEAGWCGRTLRGAEGAPRCCQEAPAGWLREERAASVPVGVPGTLPCAGHPSSPAGRLGEQCGVPPSHCSFTPREPRGHAPFPQPSRVGGWVAALGHCGRRERGNGEAQHSCAQESRAEGQGQPAHGRASRAPSATLQLPQEMRCPCRDLQALQRS